jgi:hypothetical protein
MTRLVRCKRHRGRAVIKTGPGAARCAASEPFAIIAGAGDLRQNSLWQFLPGQPPAQSSRLLLVLNPMQVSV